MPHTQDIVANHLLEMPDPNVTIARVCTPLPVEVVVRGYITGVTNTALWYRYSQGERNIYGIDFPDGLHKNDALPDPDYHADHQSARRRTRRAHHQRRSRRAWAGRPPKLWDEVSAAAVAVFRAARPSPSAAG